MTYRRTDSARGRDAAARLRRFLGMSFAQKRQLLLNRWERRVKARRLRSGPRMLDLVPSHRCNLRCVGCVHYDNEGPGDLELDFFKQISATDRPLDRLYLTGGSAQVVHMKESLGERLNTQVELLNPFRKIPPAGRDVSAELINEMMPTASVAVGLALRKLGD